MPTLVVSWPEALLSQKSLTEGMVLLGAVRSLGPYRILVALPGHICGHVPITGVSELYTEALESIAHSGGVAKQEFHPLPDMYRIGQHVVVKVIELDPTKKDVKISLSPRDIQSDWSRTMLQTGITVVAAVRSVEEHVYVMDVGITGVRAFLKKKCARNYEESWNHGKPLGIGQVVRCAIVKSDILLESATVELTADHRQVSEACADLSSVNLDSILPGTICNISVSRILRNGLEVTFSDVLTGYVYQNHLVLSRHRPENYVPGENYSARLLYVLPTVKLAYFTLAKGIYPPKPSTVLPLDVLTIGTIVEDATVIHTGNKGILLALGKKSDDLRGWVSLIRCMRTGYKETDGPVSIYLRNKYPKGSKVMCRVLNYDYMEQDYVCSMETSVLNALYVHPSNLKIAETVSCVIDSMNDKDMRVCIVSGNNTNERGLMAHVDFYHLADMPLKHPEKKFTPGSKWQAKVLYVNNLSTHLTLKPSLLTSKIPPLTRYEDAQVGQCYEGTVVNIYSKGLLVSFYGGVRGFVPERKINFTYDDSPGNMFYIGQTVKCYVVDVDVPEEQITLAFISPHDREKCDVEIGRSYTMTITTVDSNGLQVKGPSWSGFIPSQHLTDSPVLAQSLVNTYKKGTKIVAYCWSINNPCQPVFTLRPSIVKFFTDNTTASVLDLGLSAVEVGMIMPCSVARIKSYGILVELPVRGLYEPLLVPLKKIEEDFSRRRGETYNPNFMEVSDEYLASAEDFGVTLHQGLMCKVINIKDNKLNVTLRLSMCWDNNLEDSVELLKNHLKESDRIIKHLKKQGLRTAQLIHGDKVSGVVLEASNLGAIVKLDIDVETLVMPQHCPRGMKQGDKVEGKVLFVDPISGRVDITFNPLVLELINQKQDGKVREDCQVDTHLRIRVVVVTSNYLKVILKGDKGCYQFAYVPTSVHLNHLHPDIRQYKLGANQKMVLKSMEGDKIIGLLADNVLALKRLNKKIEHDKLKLKRNSLGSDFSPPIKKLKHSKNNKDNSGFGHDTEEIVEVKEENDDEPDVKIENEDIDVKDEDEYSSYIEIKEESDIEEPPKIQNQNSSLEFIIDSSPILKRNKIKKKVVEAELIKEDVEIKEEELSGFKDTQSEDFRRFMKIPKPSFDVISLDSESITSNDMGTQKSGLLNKKKMKKNIGVKKHVHEIEVLCVESDNSNAGEVNKLKRKNVKQKKIKGGLVIDKGVRNSSVDSNLILRNNNSNSEQSDSKKMDNKVVSEHSDSESDDDGGLKRLSLKTGFVWNPKPEQLPVLLGERAVSESSSEDEDTEKSGSKKKKKRLSMAEKRELARQEEARLHEVELRLMDQDRTPQSADDFDRLVLASPNNSTFWIQYMAFHLQATEIEKARAVAEKALKTIAFRQEAEKLNVWVALLNLENLYGTSDSVGKVLERAVQMNDPQKVYLKMLQIYCDSQKAQEADELIGLVCKKFRDKQEVWIQANTVYMKLGLIEKSRNLLQRALNNLDRKQHVVVITKFAQLEQQFGSPERAQTLMEQILVSYPGRIDVWSSYVDMLVKSGRIDLASPNVSSPTPPHQDNAVNNVDHHAPGSSQKKTNERCAAPIHGLRCVGVMECLLAPRVSEPGTFHLVRPVVAGSDQLASPPFRHVLERAVAQKLSTHKMKSLFKKFLSFEETHGTPELVTNVRQLALNYVEASTGT
uniref:S1 motif domain-containing protein n=1 Tax=Timema cristinae TaxID=61476 RepID=A0A7R9CVU7_TIMCR|nr:unnamed protein product [Timema cristinae]